MPFSEFSELSYVTKTLARKYCPFTNTLEEEMKRLAEEAGSCLDEKYLGFTHPMVETCQDV